MGRFEVESKVSVETKSLDTMYKNGDFSNMDFIKIDVQGGELDILQGGKQCLAEQVLGVQVEVEFAPMYENQPLFTDVDVFIRKNLDLQIHDLRHAYWKYKEGVNIGANKGQLIFGDALYFKPPQKVLLWAENFEHSIASRKIQMAYLMGIFYGYLDYSLCLLNQPSINRFFDQKTIDLYKSLLLKQGQSWHYSGKGAGLMNAWLKPFYSFFRPNHGRWASSSGHLGSTKKLGIYH